ncbi:MAG: 2'-5' RNA ligase family protein [Actinomycetes bacterium]
MAKLEPMRDHWWWRPGWRVGRSFYTWHVTFADQSAVARLVADYAPLLERFPQLDPVPLRWLHLTMQGIGFTDEVDHADIDGIVDAARRHCTELEPFIVTIGPARVDPESMQVPVGPVTPLAALRDTVRAAIGVVLSTERVPEEAGGYRPHVSLGYSNSPGPAEPIADALARHGQHTTEVTVSLINLNRDHKTYEWAEIATVPLGRL